MTDKEIFEILRSLYASAYGTEHMETVAITRLAQAGSDRRYFRMSGVAGNCIGTYSPDAREGKCFVDLARNFHRAGCRVPRIIATSVDCRVYLQEDLGEKPLFSMLNDEKRDDLVKSTLRHLVTLQQTPLSVWGSDCMAGPICKRQIMWDLNYFKYDFLRPAGIEFSEDRLENDFELLASRIESIPQCYKGFMMRDCQSRNVMVTEGGVKFIDFQGGRFGPSLYDAVSLLWQARAGLSPEYRIKMLDYYADAYCNGDREKGREMLKDYPTIVIFRTLQVLGAYGFRGLIQNRAHFLLSLPGAVRNIMQLKMNGMLDDYDELGRICEMLGCDPRFQEREAGRGLRVEIFSFSYKKGYPKDLSGNGGGFMFDCRAMHNPGRYEEYKKLTGRDLAVVEFLEKRGEVNNFLNGVWSLTDPAVERYLARGFSNLQIGFGCTGGQHRSVYCAEATFRHISTLFPEADVVLVHSQEPWGLEK